MGNNHGGIPPLVAKNWQQVNDQPNSFRNRLTCQYVHKHIVNLSSQDIQLLKQRIKQTDTTICRVHFYHQFHQSIYHVYTDQTHQIPIIKNRAIKLQIIQAFQNLALQYGFTKVCSKMIGSDSNGNIKVWINPDPVSCKLWSPCNSQQVMLNDIILLINNLQPSDNKRNKTTNSLSQQKFKTFSSYITYEISMMQKQQIINKINRTSTLVSNNKSFNNTFDQSRRKSQSGFIDQNYIRRNSGVNYNQEKQRRNSQGGYNQSQFQQYNQINNNQQLNQNFQTPINHLKSQGIIMSQRKPRYSITGQTNYFLTKNNTVDRQKSKVKLQQNYTDNQKSSAKSVYAGMNLTTNNLNINSKNKNSQNFNITMNYSSMNGKNSQRNYPINLTINRQQRPSRRQSQKFRMIRSGNYSSYGNNTQNINNQSNQNMNLNLQYTSRVDRNQSMLSEQRSTKIAKNTLGKLLNNQLNHKTNDRYSKDNKSTIGFNHYKGVIQKNNQNKNIQQVLFLNGKNKSTNTTRRDKSQKYPYPLYLQSKPQLNGSTSFNLNLGGNIGYGACKVQCSTDRTPGDRTPVPQCQGLMPIQSSHALPIGFLNISQINQQNQNTAPSINSNLSNEKYNQQMTLRIRGRRNTAAQLKQQINNILDQPVVSFSPYKQNQTIHRSKTQDSQNHHNIQFDNQQLTQIKQKVQQKKARFAQLKMDARKILEDF